MKKNLVFILLVSSVIGLCSCQEKGPLEKAGERSDEVIDNVKHGDPIFHKKGALEKAGESVDDAIDDKKD